MRLNRVPAFEPGTIALSKLSDVSGYLYLSLLFSMPFVYAGCFFVRAVSPLGQSPVPYIVGFRSLLVALFLLFLGILPPVSVASATSELPLPSVNLSGNQITEGRLLSHADGYWHVLVPEQGSIFSVPDEKAGEVRISR